MKVHALINTIIYLLTINKERDCYQTINAIVYAISNDDIL